jgi:TRAP-type C4-dicarboxylate transport system permease small subunit
MRKVRRSSPLYVAGLVASGLVVGRLLPPLTVRLDGTSPPVPGWAAAVVLFCGAIAIGALAWGTWQNLHRDKRQYSAEHAIRILALAKAAVLVGGVFAGGYAGYALAYLGSSTELGELRLWRSAVAAGAALLLLFAALVLEWACRLPSDDDEESASDADPSPA